MLASERDPGQSVSGSDEAKEIVNGRGGWQVARYACIDNWVEEHDSDGWQGRWSDHRAVKVRIDKI